MKHDIEFKAKKTCLFVAAISTIHLEWTGSASLRIERRPEADVVSGCGTDKRGVGEARKHVEGGGQHCGVSGYPQWTFNRHLLEDLITSRDFVIQPLCHQVLGIKNSLRTISVKKVI